jgi:hypothetical protein
MPSLLALVQLFDWASGRQVWPPPRPPMGAAFAASMMAPYDGRFTADWAKDREQRVAAVRVEQQRVANHLAHQTREQEERDNAETRERAAALRRKNHV